jgi:hypothetical protein
MARAALAARKALAGGSPDPDFHRAKIVTARFYVDHILPRGGAYWHELMHGAGSTLALDEAHF